MEEQQPIILRALDFFNSIVPHFRILNVCRAKTQYDPTYGHCACGLSYPDKMWLQLGERWKFKCSDVWDEFVRIGTGKDADTQDRSWLDDLVLDYGEDYNILPKVGCNANFWVWTADHRG